MQDKRSPRSKLYRCIRILENLVKKKLDDKETIVEEKRHIYLLIPAFAVAAVALVLAFMSENVIITTIVELTMPLSTVIFSTVYYWNWKDYAKQRRYWETRVSDLRIRCDLMEEWDMKEYNKLTTEIKDLMKQIKASAG